MSGQRHDPASAPGDAELVGRLDNLVFIGAIPENGAEIRLLIGQQLAWFGVAVRPRSKLDHVIHLHHARGPSPAARSRTPR